MDTAPMCATSFAPALCSMVWNCVWNKPSSTSTRASHISASLWFTHGTPAKNANAAAIVSSDDAVRAITSSLVR